MRLSHEQEKDKGKPDNRLALKFSEFGYIYKANLLFKKVK
jgi:hypothetical protein